MRGGLLSFEEVIVVSETKTIQELLEDLTLQRVNTIEWSIEVNVAQEGFRRESHLGFGVLPCRRYHIRQMRQVALFNVCLVWMR